MLLLDINTYINTPKVIGEKVSSYRTQTMCIVNCVCYIHLMSYNSAVYDKTIYYLHVVNPPPAAIKHFT